MTEVVPSSEPTRLQLGSARRDMAEKKVELPDNWFDQRVVEGVARDRKSRDPEVINVRTFAPLLPSSRKRDNLQ